MFNFGFWFNEAIPKPPGINDTLWLQVIYEYWIFIFIGRLKSEDSEEETTENNTEKKLVVSWEWYVYQLLY